MESGKEIVQTGKGGSGPDSRNQAIRLDENEATGFRDPQLVSQLGIGIPKGWKVYSSFCHEFMNLVLRTRKNEKPGGFCLGFFHGNGEVFRKLDAAVTVVGKENKHHRLAIMKGGPGSRLAIHSIQNAPGDGLACRLVEGLKVGRG